MKCKYCGQRLMDSAKRCPICKTEFTEADIAEMLAAGTETGTVPQEKTGWSRPASFEDEAERRARREEAWAKAKEESWKKLKEGTAYQEADQRETWEREGAYSPEELKRRGLARGGFFCGITAVITCFVSPGLSMGISAAGFVSSILGLKSEGKNRAVAGIVLCVMAFFAAICFRIMTNALMDNIDWTELMREIQGMMTEQQLP